MKFSIIAAALLGAVTPAAAATLPSYITANNSPPPTDKAFINECMQKVNSIRGNYGTAPLEWSVEIAQVALRKSNGCRLDHSGDYGENAYMWWTNPPEIRPDFLQQVRDAFDAWVSQEERDAYRRGDLLAGAHFTQTVWKSSRRMGCAFSTIRCTNNENQEWWFYCDFDPPGNYEGEYEENVQY